MNIKLTFDLLPVLAVMLSLLASYFPGFKEWFAKLTPERKQLFMAGALFLVDLIVVGLSLAGFLDVYNGSSWQEWVWYPVVDFFLALISNAGTYQATKHIYPVG